jgi:hypothetical protein
MTAAQTTAAATAGAAPGAAEALLRAWETLHAAGPVERALGLLTAIWPEFDRETWRRMSLGDRDACLFMAHEALFGGALQTTAVCPACGERLESRFAVRDLCAPPRSLPPPRATCALEYDGWHVRYRLPCSEDLLALAAARGETQDTAAALLRRCVIEARHGDDEVAPAQWPPALRRRLGEAMADEDPLADVRIALACPACDHGWSATLEIGAYLWEEVDDWAQSLLVEVHQLARHYAWCERDILAMSPVRRRFYLDLVRA